MDTNQFGDLLSEAIDAIKRCKGGKSLTIIRDEIGYALNEEKSGRTIESWRYRKRPLDVVTLENLAEVLIDQSCGHLDRNWLEVFLINGEHPYPERLCDQFFPPPTSSLGIQSQTTNSEEKEIFQVPIGIRDFVGRENLLSELKTCLHQDGAIAILHGLGGVGKTSTAIHVANAIKDEFPDGILWGDLEGAVDEYGNIKEIALKSIFHTFGQTFGRDLTELDLSSQSTAFREIVTNKRLLIILDNAHSTEDAELFLPPSGTPSSVLITSRNRRVLSEQSITLFEVDIFNQEECLTLFSNVIGEDHLQKEIAGAKQICEFLGNLPIAIRIIANLTNESETLSLLEYADELKNEKALLEGLDDWTDASKNVRASFELSLKHLDSTSQLIFLSLGVFSSKTFSIEAVQAINKISSVKTKINLGRLRSLSLIANTENINDGRYSLHPLIRVFIREKLGILDKGSENKNEFFKQTQLFPLSTKIYDHFNIEDLKSLSFSLDIEYEDILGQTKTTKVEEFVKFVYRRGRITELITRLKEEREHVIWPSINESKQIQEAPLPDYDSLKPNAKTYFLDLAKKQYMDFNRIDLDWENIEDALNYAEEHNEWETFIDTFQKLTFIRLGVVGFLDARGYWQNALLLADKCLNALSMQASRLTKGTLELKKGAFALKLNQFEKADELLDDSLHSLKRLENDEDVFIHLAYIHDFLSQLNLRTEIEDALKHSKNAIEILQKNDSSKLLPEQGYMIIRYASILARSGKFEDAKKKLEEGLSLFGKEASAAKVSGYITLGGVIYYLGKPKDAIPLWEKGIKNAKSIGDRFREAQLHQNIGNAYSFLGGYDDSTKNYEQALEIYQYIGYHLGQSDIQNNLGINYLILSQYDSCNKSVKSALELAESNQLISQKAQALVIRARLQIKQTVITTAEQDLNQAKDIASSLQDDLLLSEIYHLQASLLLLQGHSKEALSLAEKSIDFAVEPVEEGKGWRTKGDIQRILNNNIKANQFYKQSQLLLTDQDQYELGYTLLNWGMFESSIENFSSAESLLSQAKDIFSDLSLQIELDLTDKLLSEIQLR